MCTKWRCEYRSILPSLYRMYLLSVVNSQKPQIVGYSYLQEIKSLNSLSLKCGQDLLMKWIKGSDSLWLQIPGHKRHFSILLSYSSWLFALWIKLGAMWRGHSSSLWRGSWAENLGPPANSHLSESPWKQILHVKFNLQMITVTANSLTTTTWENLSWILPLKSFPNS